MVGAQKYNPLLLKPRLSSYYIILSTHSTSLLGAFQADYHHRWARPTSRLSPADTRIIYYYLCRWLDLDWYTRHAAVVVVHHHKPQLLSFMLHSRGREMMYDMLGLLCVIGLLGRPDWGLIHYIDRYTEGNCVNAITRYNISVGKYNLSSVLLVVLWPQINPSS